MNPPAVTPTLRHGGRIAAEYGTAAAVSLLAGLLALHIWKADLRTPFVYHDDALYYGLLVKTIVDQGGWLSNTHLGAPGILQLHDFPAADTLHLFTIKVMAWFTPNWAVLVNLYFIMGFPLIAVSALAVFRHFRSGYWSALAASVLYALLPSRLVKNEAHLFLDVFYEVPLAILVALWVCSDKPPLFRDRGAGKRAGIELRSRRSVAALVICLVTATTGVYYAFFAGVLLFLGGIWASVECRTLRNAASGLMLIGVIVAGLVAQGVPTYLYHLRHGTNPQVAARSAVEAETFGMKITELLLPTIAHRLPPLRRLKERYETPGRPRGEGAVTSLGLVGSVGFLFLLAVLLLTGRMPRGEPARDLPRRLAILNIFALLLATVGGFGSLFALLVTPQIRSYARMNVFIAFLALFGVVLLIERVVARFKRLSVILPVAILVVGLLDQVTPAAVRPYARAGKEYQNDAAYIHAIEATLPAEAMIFQLPHQIFPEAPPTPGQANLGYDLLHPYLHTRTLRWTYPAMAGRVTDAWLTDVAKRPPAALARSLADAGFEGILIDRLGYDDRAAAMESALRDALAAQPFVSGDARLAFFDLGAYNRRTLAGVSSEERARRREQTLPLLFLSFGEGCYGTEMGPNGPFRWFAETSTLQIENNSPRDRTATLSMTLFAAQPPSVVHLDGDLWSASLTLPPQGLSFSRTLTIAPGVHVIRFHSEGRSADAPLDPRNLFWHAENFLFRDLTNP